MARAEAVREVCEEDPIKGVELIRVIQVGGQAFTWRREGPPYTYMRTQCTQTSPLASCTHCCAVLSPMHTLLCCVQECLIGGYIHAPAHHTHRRTAVPLQECLEDSAPQVQALALRCISLLCEADSLDFYKAWRVVQAAFPSLPAHPQTAAAWVHPCLCYSSSCCFFLILRGVIVMGACTGSLSSFSCWC